MCNGSKTIRHVSSGFRVISGCVFTEKKAVSILNSNEVRYTD